MRKVHVVDVGKMFLFEVCRVIQFLIQSLTRCKKVDSESDKTQKL